MNCGSLSGQIIMARMKTYSRVKKEKRTCSSASWLCSWLELQGFSDCSNAEPESLRVWQQETGICYALERSPRGDFAWRYRCSYKAGTQNDSSLQLGGVKVKPRQWRYEPWNLLLLRNNESKPQGPKSIFSRSTCNYTAEHQHLYLPMWVVTHQLCEESPPGGRGDHPGRKRNTTRHIPEQNAPRSPCSGLRLCVFEHSSWKQRHHAHTHTVETPPLRVK